MSIASQIQKIKSELPSTCKLVAVSKFHHIEEIMEAYNVGQRIFGENRPQELAQKAPNLPPDTEWHFIGHLQTNKLKFVVPYATLIHSVDSLKLLMEIDKFAVSKQLKVKCLLELFIAQEDTKHGFSEQELLDLFKDISKNALHGVEICGLMGMASFTNDEEQIRSEFSKLSKMFNDIKSKYSSYFPNFKELSMGMSGDYLIALEYGSTLVRIGTSIFGQRQY